MGLNNLFWFLVGVGSAIGGEQLFKGLLVDKKIDHAALATYEIMNYLKKTDPSSYENDKVGIGSANGSSSVRLYLIS